MKQLIKRLGIIPALLLALATQSPAQEDPNIIEDESGRLYYIVQKGDTLWDISKRFLDSPWYWPEIWKENSNLPILNPHLIYPGQRIRLYRRGELPEVAELPPAEFVPPPEVAPPPEPEPLPPVPKAPVEERFYVYTPINQVGFIRREPIQPSGEVVKVRGTKTMISTGDVVYVTEPPETPLNVGSYYTVYREMAPVFDKDTNALIGTQHLLTGVVEITRKAPEMTIAEVKTAYRAIKVGDKLMPYEPRATKIVMTDSTPDITGKIIFSEGRTFVMGQHQVAFIDKGELDGLRVGQEYMIFEQDSVQPDPNRNKAYLMPPSDIGTVLVLLTQPNTSTVLITRSEKDISDGTKIRTPVVE